MLKNKTVLITGATGFIGANLALRSLENGNLVHVINKKSTSRWRLQSIKKKVISHYVSLSDLPALTKLVHKIKPDIIFHLATNGAYSNQTDLTEMIQTNIVATTNLLLATQNVPYQTFVNTGSSSEYGFKNRPMQETNLLEPASYYAGTKAASTLIAQSFGKVNNKNIVTIRPFSVYGPWEEPTRLIPTLIKQSLKNKDLNLTPNKSTHDFIYIDDVIDAYLKAAVTKGIAGKIINIGTGIQYSNLQIAKKITLLTNSNSKINIGGYTNRNWDSPFWVADINFTKKVLKWSPPTNFDTGLKKTVAWIKNHQDTYG